MSLSDALISPRTFYRRQESIFRHPDQRTESSNLNLPSLTEWRLDTPCYQAPTNMAAPTFIYPPTHYAGSSSSLTSPQAPPVPSSFSSTSSSSTSFSSPTTTNPLLSYSPNAPSGLTVLSEVAGDPKMALQYITRESPVDSSKSKQSNHFVFELETPQVSSSISAPITVDVGRPRRSTSTESRAMHGMMNSFRVDPFATHDGVNGRPTRIVTTISEEPRVQPVHEREPLVFSFQVDPPSDLASDASPPSPSQQPNVPTQGSEPTDPPHFAFDLGYPENVVSQPPQGGFSSSLNTSGSEHTGSHHSSPSPSTESESEDSPPFNGSHQGSTAARKQSKTRAKSKPKSRSERPGKKHACALCKKVFSRPSGLKTHMNTHSGEKPFPCPLKTCSKTFAVRSNARRHLRTHGIEYGRNSRSKGSKSPQKEVHPTDFVNTTAQPQHEPAERWIPPSLATRTNVDRLASRPPFQTHGFSVASLPLPAVTPSETDSEERDSFADDRGIDYPYHPAHWGARPRLPGPALLNSRELMSGQARSWSFSLRRFDS